MTNAPSATRERCDVVVIGSGLAGMSAALTAYERALDVVLVEKGE
jgi:succinate dehydrogenase/fumarate reductase flavoprotein subunit